MFPSTAHSAGGRATAIITHAAALERRKTELANYYANPNHCKECGKIITVPDGHRIGETKIKKFCNRSCAQSFTNHDLNRGRMKKQVHKKICTKCQKEFILGRNKHGKIRGTRLCPECKVHFDLRTKGQLKIIHAKAQSHNIAIRRDARRIYERSGKPMSCVACGYRLHVEIAHIKEVCEFPDTATINEINDINNLVAICCNCHWELDNKIISLGLRINGAETIAV
jgi:hypothetical protein